VGVGVNPIRNDQEDAMIPGMWPVKNTGQSDLELHVFFLIYSVILLNQVCCWVLIHNVYIW
jgi:hypothetical protein